MYRRLEKVLHECDRILTNPSGFKNIRLKTMKALINAIELSYEIISDIEVEQIEAKAEKIKRLLEERQKDPQSYK